MFEKQNLTPRSYGFRFVIQADWQVATSRAALIATEDMSHALSDDLASLIDDASVPVFLPK